MTEWAAIRKAYFSEHILFFHEFLLFSSFRLNQCTPSVCGQGLSREEEAEAPRHVLPEIMKEFVEECLKKQRKHLPQGAGA